MMKGAGGPFLTNPRALHPPVLHPPRFVERHHPRPAVPLLPALHAAKPDAEFLTPQGLRFHDIAPLPAVARQHLQPSSLIQRLVDKRARHYIRITRPA